MQLKERLQELVVAPSSEGKPALVVQGGGLRGVYSIGALAALEELGLRDAFSLVIGSSAGAMNGAYFLAGQAREGIEIYVEDLSNRRFFSPFRVTKMVDIDFLVDVALREHHPLNIGELVAAEAPLYTVLTDAVTGGEMIVSSHDPDYDAYETMRATAALPGLYNRRVAVGGRSFVDGGIAHPVPLQEAFTRGACEAIVVLTRGRGYRRLGHGVGYRIISRGLAFGQSRPVKARLGAADPTYNEAMALLENEDHGSKRRTWTVWPSDLSQLIGRTTTDRVKLRACAAMGMRDMVAVLSQRYEGREGLA